MMNRRAVLASLATGTSVATAGCTGRIRSLTGWQSPDQVKLRIKTYPNDADPYALPIARAAAEQFRAAGIDTAVVPTGREALLRDVLLNDEYDVFVSRSPGWFRTPDSMFGLLHSQFAAASGWQNPFGYTNLTADNLLETQRDTGGEARREAVADLQRTVAQTHPFTVIGFPDDIRAAGRDQFEGWMSADLREPRGYVGVERVSDSGGDGPVVLEAATTDSRPTQNLNPLAVEFRQDPDPVDLLYDSMGIRTGGETVVPWLAASWSFPEQDPAPRARMGLREDLNWHDGEALTAEDIAFTHRFLADTSLGGEEDPIPAPRYQAVNSLVESVEVIDQHLVEYRFVECDPQVALEAFTLPALPEHVWSDRTDSSSVGGIAFGGGTEALVTNNVPAIGSGPFAFAGNTPNQSLVLEPFEEHFRFRESTFGRPDSGDAPPFDRLRFRVVGSDVTAVDVVTNGDSDVTWDAVGADKVSRIARLDNLDLLVSRSHAHYFVGYNVRRAPLTNPRFRRLLARLIDKRHLAESVFDGYLEPAASMLAGTRWLPGDLEWDEGDPSTPFIGVDGEVDVGAAKDAFREIGYRFDDGRLLED